mmetsp:Transcript_31883/g.65016  ORF Transcript_31883/g.65016 Transcript_31883/m.65016 type:complete len:372 (+) Transcript_31883:152-1267(+)
MSSTSIAIIPIPHFHLPKQQSQIDPSILITLLKPIPIRFMKQCRVENNGSIGFVRNGEIGEIRWSKEMIYYKFGVGVIGFKIPICRRLGRKNYQTTPKTLHLQIRPVQTHPQIHIHRRLIGMQTYPALPLRIVFISPHILQFVSFHDSRHGFMKLFRQLKEERVVQSIVYVRSHVLTEFERCFGLIPMSISQEELAYRLKGGGREEVVDDERSGNGGGGCGRGILAVSEPIVLDTLEVQLIVQERSSILGVPSRIDFISRFDVKCFVVYISDARFVIGLGEGVQSLGSAQVFQWRDIFQDFFVYWNYGRLKVICHGRFAFFQYPSEITRLLQIVEQFVLRRVVVPTAPRNQFGGQFPPDGFVDIILGVARR